VLLTEGELEQLRADEADLLPDTCTVTRASGEPVFDANTGTYTAPDPTTIYTGACRIAPLSVQDRAVLFGERAVDLVAYQGTFPYDAPVFQKDDVLEVTLSADDQLVGRHLEIHGYEVKSLQTKRRVLLQEVR
jgi:hypothetical protein